MQDQDRRLVAVDADFMISSSSNNSFYSRGVIESLGGIESIKVIEARMFDLLIQKWSVLDKLILHHVRLNMPISHWAISRKYSCENCMHKRQL